MLYKIILNIECCSNILKYHIFVFKIFNVVNFPRYVTTKNSLQKSIYVCNILSKKYYIYSVLVTF